MFDFLSPQAIVWAFLVNAWTAISLPALSATVVGAGMIAVAVLIPLWFPGVWRWLLITVGTLLVLVSIAFQAGKAEGVRVDQVLQHQRAIAAEADRAAAAEAIKNRIAAQAAADHEKLSADIAKLKGLNDALRTDPHRDRECLDRGLARRLRAL